MKNGILSFFRQYKVIYIQVVVFTIIGLYKHNQALLFFSAALMLLPLVSGRISAVYIKTLDYILNKIGLWLKYILFFIFYFFIFCPIALFFYKKNENEGYIKHNGQPDFMKMW